MDRFEKYFLMIEADVASYVRYKLPDFFDKGSDLLCKEIGDGNLNYVFRVRDAVSGKTIIVKQAGEELRISKEMHVSTDRGRIEAHILKIQNEYAPGLVPEVYCYDPVMCAILMEDMTGHKMMRTALIDHEIYPKFAEQISDFLAKTLFFTSDICMDHKEKERLSAEFVNPDLCEITHDLVYTEPYINDKNRNIVFEPNMEFVQKEIYEDEELHLAAARLKFDFLTDAQSLIHGDLHTGSIFINKEHIYVFDPEFAFYGPAGYDTGNVIANMLFAHFNGLETIKDKEERNEFTSWTLSSVQDIVDLFVEKLSALYDKEVKDPMAKVKGFKEYYIKKILLQTAGVTGLELIRRIVGMAKVKDITVIEDEKKRLHAERSLLIIAKKLILNPEAYNNGSDYISLVNNTAKSIGE